MNKATLTDRRILAIQTLVQKEFPFLFLRLVGEFNLRRCKGKGVTVAPPMGQKGK
jgi:hypothetical protein